MATVIKGGASADEGEYFRLQATTDESETPIAFAVDLGLRALSR